MFPNVFTKLFTPVVTARLHSLDKKLYSLAPEPSLSTWIVKEAAAGSSTSQNSSPLVGITRAAGNVGPSLPSSTSYKKMFSVTMQSIYFVLLLCFCIWSRLIYDEVTFKTAALLPPVDTKATQCAEFTTGKVIVTRCGGGLGESLMGATIFFAS